jgi:hypothetical protein
MLLAMLSMNVFSATETIVMIRHAEKPDGGLGQLSCQGLNRALALPKVLLGKFGTPAAIFAPNPGMEKLDQGHSYNYIRPLATIEPTAIRVGLPVNTRWGFEDIASLKSSLLGNEMVDKTVFVAWEHRLLEQLSKDLLEQLGEDSSAVPVWKGDDFDSIYVIKIRVDGDGKRSASFRIDHQHLNKLSTKCPKE